MASLICLPGHRRQSKGTIGMSGSPQTEIVMPWHEQSTNEQDLWLHSRIERKLAANGIDPSVARHAKVKDSFVAEIVQKLSRNRVIVLLHESPSVHRYLSHIIPTVYSHNYHRSSFLVTPAVYDGLIGSTQAPDHEAQMQKALNSRLIYFDQFLSIRTARDRFSSASYTLFEEWTNGRHALVLASQEKPETKKSGILTRISSKYGDFALAAIEEESEFIIVGESK